MSCEQFFQKKLRQHGLRLTAQRKGILLALHEVDWAVSAEEVFSRVAAKDADIDLSTVYRTLDLLCEMQMVTVIDRGEKQRLYELNTSEEPHLHLVCLGCGQITGVPFDLLEPLRTHLKENLGFNADFSTITIQGLCKGCGGEMG
jgi:Fur family ferric uptake transcriptional regulator